MFEAIIKSVDSQYNTVINGDYDTVFFKAYKYLKDIWASIDSVDITSCFDSNQCELWANDKFGNEFVHTYFIVKKVEN